MTTIDFTTYEIKALIRAISWTMNYSNDSEDDIDLKSARSKLKSVSS